MGKRPNERKEGVEKVYMRFTTDDPLMTEYELDLKTQMANCLPEEARMYKLKNQHKAYTLARDGAELDEISFYLGMDQKKVSDEFAYQLLRGKVDRNMMLRRSQMRAAVSGSSTMQTFLDKKLFGDSGSKELTINIRDVP